MKKSYYSPHLPGMKTAQTSAQIQIASQIMPKYHQAHKSGVLKEAVGLKGVILPSARNESIQQSVNFSRRFWCMVNKSLTQAKIPSAADVPLVSQKSLRTQLQLCHQISDEVRGFVAIPCQVEVILIEQFQEQKWLSLLYKPLPNTGNSKWLFQSSSKLDTLQWCVRLLSTLSYEAPFLGTNNFVKY